MFNKDRKRDLHFVIAHYAGAVSYNCDGFLEKNRDLLTFDLVELLQSSRCEFIQALYPKGDSSAGADRKHSLAAQFQKQLTRLMAQLNRSPVQPYIAALRTFKHQPPLPPPPV